MPTNDSVHHPIFARFYRRISEASRVMLDKHRIELLSGLHGRVIEVGCGNGLNFAHYPADVDHVLGVEPESYLRELAIRAAAASPIDITVVAGMANALPADDASVDAVVFSLVLCSVDDQAAALAEAARVLTPRGELRFYEHVVSPTARLASVQRGTDVVWPKLFGGCRTARDTVGSIESARFTDVDFRRFDLKAGPVPTPVSPHVLGRARLAD